MRFWTFEAVQEWDLTSAFSSVDTFGGPIHGISPITCVFSLISMYIYIEREREIDTRMGHILRYHQLGCASGAAASKAYHDRCRTCPPHPEEPKEQLGERNVNVGHGDPSERYG